MRSVTQKELTHERLGSEFEKLLNEYDTTRRVDTLIDRFLDDEMTKGKTVLDVGCGLGFFSQRLAERGAIVLGCDIGPNLVAETRRRAGCKAEVADALSLVEHFGSERFDVVVSSECIEHVPDPAEALRQMIGVLKPGGYLALSTPNRLWYPLVWFATAVGVRRFDGYEKFSTWGSIGRTLQKQDAKIKEERGLHLFPFQFGMHGLSMWCDEHLQSLRGMMINICILAQKNSAPD